LVDKPAWAPLAQVRARAAVRRMRFMVWSFGCGGALARGLVKAGLLPPSMT
jgi:hypothetical protein